jgi:phosphatidylserine/phosphatidylglycerophosphate/cardiolipin synthase-like enzyme
MRFKSATKGGLQVFAVAGTNTVSFGIRATATARKGLLGFGIERVDRATNERHWVKGYKVFRSIIPNPTPKTKVSTEFHPVQSLVWDDFTAAPDREYDYVFHPLKGTPANLDRTTPPVTISIRTEALSAGAHDVFFNRGVTGSQSYAINFGNKAPDKQPTAQRKADAFAWLSRDLDEAIVDFICSAKKGDAIRGCFYEFRFAPVLKALKAAIDRGVDVKLIVDQKVNERTIKPTPKNKLKKPKFEPSNPRVANLQAIKDARLPDGAIIPREARKDDIQHNKFMVLLRGKTSRRPTEVWTGSTNLTDGGIYGQANVGHRVRDERTAALYLAYWKLLEGDPGAPTDAKTSPINIEFLTAVDDLSPAPKSVQEIPQGITPLFSPRGHLGPLDLYVEMLANAKSLSCGTFAFGIPRPFRTAINANGKKGPLRFLLLEEKDRPRPTKARPEPVILLNSTNNTYKATGSELNTTLGRWVAETNNKQIGLNVHVTYIHLKFILRDPLGPDPIVVTGSANFSDASTTENDENMILIRGDRRVADIYFTEFNRLWGHYQYRSVVEDSANRKPVPGSPAPHNYQDLWENTDWQKDYEPGDLRSKRVDQYVRMAI